MVEITSSHISVEGGLWWLDKNLLDGFSVIKLMLRRLLDYHVHNLHFLNIDFTLSAATVIRSLDGACFSMQQGEGGSLPRYPLQKPHMLMEAAICVRICGVFFSFVARACKQYPTAVYHIAERVQQQQQQHERLRGLQQDHLRKLQKLQEYLCISAILCSKYCFILYLLIDQ